MRMRPLGTLGIVMLVLGLAALGYQGVTYTSPQTFPDIALLTVARPTQSSLPPLAGLAVATTGAVLLIIGARRKD